MSGMRKSPPSDAVHRIRMELAIADIVGELIWLTRRGSIFIAKCPWHRDERPSLVVYPQRNTWRCWPCDIQGDAIDFVAKFRGISIDHAAIWLASRLK